MTRPSPYPTKADIKRLIQAMNEAEVEVASVEVRRDGTIRFNSKVGKDQGSAYDRWKQGSDESK